MHTKQGHKGPTAQTMPLAHWALMCCALLVLSCVNHTDTLTDSAGDDADAVAAAAEHFANKGAASNHRGNARAKLPRSFATGLADHVSVRACEVADGPNRGSYALDEKDTENKYLATAFT